MTRCSVRHTAAHKTTTEHWQEAALVRSIRSSHPAAARADRTCRRARRDRIGAARAWMVVGTHVASRIYFLQSFCCLTFSYDTHNASLLLHLSGSRNYYELSLQPVCTHRITVYMYSNEYTVQCTNMFNTVQCTCTISHTYFRASLTYSICVPVCFHPTAPYSDEFAIRTSSFVECPDCDVPANRAHMWRVAHWHHRWSCSASRAASTSSHTGTTRS